MPNAEVVSIGSELLLGQIVDTNSAWMARRLTDIGVDLYYKTIVGDNPDRMKSVIDRSVGPLRHRHYRRRPRPDPGRPDPPDYRRRYRP